MEFAPKTILSLVDLSQATANVLSWTRLFAEKFGSAGIGRETMTVLRSGCYLTQDSAQYEKAFRRILERSATARSVTVR